MTDDGAKKINDAIKDCLRACYGAESPLATIAAFLCNLRESHDWNDAEAELVELGVHRMLKMMVRRSALGEFEPLVAERPDSSEAAVQEEVVALMNDASLASCATKNPPESALAGVIPSAPRNSSVP